MNAIISANFLRYFIYIDTSKCLNFYSVIQCFIYTSQYNTYIIRLYTQKNEIYIINALVKIQFLLCEIRLYHSQYTQHVHNLARFFIFLLEKRCYKIINWGKLINVDGTLVFLRRHIIVPIVLKNISIVQLLSASLHRSHLNKGCTCIVSTSVVNLEISNGEFYPMKMILGSKN